MKLAKIFIALVICFVYIQAKDYAKVNGENVNTQDINNMMKNFKHLGEFDKLNKDQQDIVLTQTIDSKITKQIALKDKISQTKLYKDSLKTIKDKLLVEVWMKTEYENINISDQEIKIHYNKNKQDYITKHEIKARHIVLKTKKEANEILALLKKENEATLQKAFINLAVKHSIGPSASNGGSLGWFSKGKMLDSFWKVCDSLKQNQYAKTPLQTEFGYHIIYVDGVQLAYTMKLQDAKKEIKDKLKEIKFQKQITQKIKMFKQKSNIKIY
ncbi:MAG: hypothetical protein DRG11_00860 [Epsilonproteobacteria bacterium]|nr:MAG: hypothetical protein DRG11_00860 [Campylobacterota bacterium]